MAEQRYSIQVCTISWSINQSTIIERRIFADYKFSNKNDIPCAWRDFQKNIIWCTYDALIYECWSQKLTIFHFEQVDKVWISGKAIWRTSGKNHHRSIKRHDNKWVLFEITVFWSINIKLYKLDPIVWFEYQIRNLNLEWTLFVY